MMREGKGDDDGRVNEGKRQKSGGKEEGRRGDADVIAGTFNGNPVSCAAALATIEYLKADYVRLSGYASLSPPLSLR